MTPTAFDDISEYDSAFTAVASLFQALNPRLLKLKQISCAAHKLSLTVKAALGGKSASCRRRLPCAQRSHIGKRQK